MHSRCRDLDTGQVTNDEAPRRTLRIPTRGEIQWSNRHVGGMRFTTCALETRDPWISLALGGLPISDNALLSRRMRDWSLRSRIPRRTTAPPSRSGNKSIWSVPFRVDAPRTVLTLELLLRSPQIEACLGCIVPGPRRMRNAPSAAFPLGLQLPRTPCGTLIKRFAESRGSCASLLDRDPPSGVGTHLIKIQDFYSQTCYACIVTGLLAFNPSRSSSAVIAVSCDAIRFHLPLQDRRRLCSVLPTMRPGVLEKTGSRLTAPSIHFRPRTPAMCPPNGALFRSPS